MILLDQKALGKKASLVGGHNESGKKEECRSVSKDFNILESRSRVKDNLKRRMADLYACSISSIFLEI